MMENKTAKDFKGKIPNMENLSEFESNFNKMREDMETRVMPMFQKLSEEQAKLSRPAKRKNLLIDGKSCVVSLIIDGRILINFPTVEEGEQFFEAFTDFSEARNKWWYKLFTFFKK